MKKEYEVLYNDMLADINRCLTLEHPEKENVESCFWIARNYWEQLQKMIMRLGFKSDDDEINFFKITKPQFTRYIEYFSLLSEGLMFVPPDLPVPEELKVEKAVWDRMLKKTVTEYWTKEEDRGNRFYAKHNVFLEYCGQGLTDKDEEYFIVSNAVPIESNQRRAHNRDTELFTPCEEIWTTWQAYQLYSAYIKKKVSEPVNSLES